MRIKSVRLSWFRGAAEPVLLDPDEKSIVVYGENGAGKSSFVDAVEYAINDGKIGHLSHEDSGKRQERGIPNTHTPGDRTTGFLIQFKDDSEFQVDIKRDGTSKTSGTKTAAIETWDYRRTVLRQDEVAKFIQNTKGEKYSALLPLLGLQYMETAAENLRKLARSIEQESKLKEIKAGLEIIAAQKTSHFGKDDSDVIASKIKTLHSLYCPAQATKKTSIDYCKELIQAINAKIADSSEDQRRHIILKDASELNFNEPVNTIRSASEALAAAVEPLIAEKLQVLESAVGFAKKLDKEKIIRCPACGRDISKDEFQAHVLNERTRLKEITATFETRKESIGTLCDNVKSLKAHLAKSEIKSWRDGLVGEAVINGLKFLDSLDVNTLRNSCTESKLKAIELNLVPLVAAAETAVANAPADVQKLTADSKSAEIALAVFESRKNAEFVAQVGILKTFVTSLEEETRKEIAEQSEIVIAGISGDIQDMWKILHPNEHIEEVRLHVPEDTEKAIDICLKFHGIDQDSPRLTLSEGFRNSLGLCIFLAMAKREAGTDRPIFLDDVVVSVDRNHRGMIVELLEKLFSGRQLIVLTHDRDWFIELKQQLNAENWTYKALTPYESPTLGIRWSEKTFGFDDARKLVATDPDLAGNTARKIMDIELAIRAERLKVRLPYLHRERNDHRGAHEFLSQIIEDGEVCFQKKGAKDYEKNSDALDALHDCDKLLVSWANKASHTPDVAKAEATKLIDSCEKALSTLGCPACKKSIYKLDDAKAEFVQCGCGAIRWRYGKS